MDKINKIIKMFRQNDLSHFDDFYELTKKQVFYTIINIVKSKTITEDLMQDVYIKFLNNLDKYQDNTNPYSFLVTISRNMALNEYNKRKKEIINDEVFVDLVDNKSQNNEYEIFHILKALDDIEKEIVTQHIINNLKFKDIAKLLDKPLGTVLWIYNKAIKKLKKEVKLWKIKT